MQLQRPFLRSRSQRGCSRVDFRVSEFPASLLDFAIDFQQLQSTRIFASIDSGLRDLLQLLMHRIQLSKRHLHSFFIPKLGQTFYHSRPLPPHLSSATSRRLPALPVAIRYLHLSRRVKFPREIQSVGS
jgi:hypothetical protein